MLLVLNFILLPKRSRIYFKRLMLKNVCFYFVLKYFAFHYGKKPFYYSSFLDLQTILFINQGSPLMKRLCFGNKGNLHSELSEWEKRKGGWCNHLSDNPPPPAPTKQIVTTLPFSF